MATGVDELVLSSLPLPLARVFRDFDESIRDGLPKEETKKKRSLLGMKQKKKIGALEGWVSELSVIYNMPQEVWQTGEFMWAEIFYQRLVCTQMMLDHKFFMLYLDVFTQYEQNNATLKKEKRPRQSRVVCSLRPWLELHRMDHDNALVGLRPNEQLCEKFVEWLNSDAPMDLTRQAEDLDRQVAAKAATEGGEVDELLLYSFGYPARRGDLVAANLDPSDPEVVNFFKRSQSVEEDEEDEDEYKIVISRVVDGVVGTDGKYLTLWVTPREDVKLKVKMTHCLPMRDLVKRIGSGTTNLDLWMGNVKAMRELVQGPFTSFRRRVDKEVARRAREFCEKHGVDLELQEIIEKAVSSANADPVSFNLYYRVSSELEKLKQLPADEIDALADDVQKWGAANLQRFVTQLNSDPDAASNKFFVPTSATDLQKVSTMSFGSRMRDKITSFVKNCEKIYEQFQSVKRELLKGTLKNELTRWWLTLIDLECAAFLANHPYDDTAFDEGTYIDEPPRSLNGVKANLEFVQELLKPEGGRVSPEPVVESLKKQIYEAIDDFVMKAHIVLKEELLAIGGNDLYSEAGASSFEEGDLDEMRTFLDTKREEVGDDKWLPLDGVLKDLKYLSDMKELEAEQERKKKDPDRELGKLALTYAVPVSGLAMGFFFRLENVLKTVIELWDRPELAEEESISGPVLVSTSSHLVDVPASDEPDDIPPRTPSPKSEERASPAPSSAPPMLPSRGPQPVPLGDAVFVTPNGKAPANRRASGTPMMHHKITTSAEARRATVNAASLAAAKDLSPLPPPISVSDLAPPGSPDASPAGTPTAASTPPRPSDPPPDSPAKKPPRFPSHRPPGKPPGRPPGHKPPGSPKPPASPKPPPPASPKPPPPGAPLNRAGSSGRLPPRRPPGKPPGKPPGAPPGRE